MPSSQSWQTSLTRKQSFFCCVSELGCQIRKGSTPLVSTEGKQGLYERKRRKVFQGSRLVGGVAEAVALHPVKLLFPVAGVAKLYFTTSSTNTRANIHF